MQLLNRILCAVMDSVEMESVQIKEEFPELEPLPFRVEFFGLASLPMKQELCEMQCDSSQPESGVLWAGFPPHETGAL
ncbi:UNVERIFIED_CONTAM: hypothetical protein FKN15_029080 [Acipenser sinensis]